MSNSRVRVLAVKKAEQSDEVIVRAVELDGKPAKGVRFAFGAPLAGAREVNGVESRGRRRAAREGRAGRRLHAVPGADVRA